MGSAAAQLPVPHPVSLHGRLRAGSCESENRSCTALEAEAQSRMLSPLHFAGQSKSRDQPDSRWWRQTPPATEGAESPMSGGVGVGRGHVSCSISDVSNVSSCVQSRALIFTPTDPSPSRRLPIRGSSVLLVVQAEPGVTTLDPLTHSHLMSVQRRHQCMPPSLPPRPHPGPATSPPPGFPPPHPF